MTLIHRPHHNGGVPAWLSLCLILGGTVSAQQDDEAFLQQWMAEAFPKQIGILVEGVSIDAQTAADLLLTYGGDANDRALRAAVDEHLRNGTATLSEMTYFITRSAQQAQIESIIEFIYPTEFDPPELPQQLTGPLEAGNQIIANATPTAFQTRHLGLTVNAAPTVAPDQDLIDLDLILRVGVHAGDDVHGQGAAQVKMPNIHSNDVTTQLTLTSGVDALAGVVTPFGRQDERMLVFVRGTVLIGATGERLQKLYFPDGVPKPGENANDEVERQQNPFAAAPGSERVSNVVTQIEYIGVDLDEAHRLLRAVPATSDATALRREVAALMASSKARLIDSALVSTRSGQRAKSRSGNERIYPIEADPPEMPQQLHGPIQPGTKIITPVHYTTFEMRPEGIALEVDPQLGPDGVQLDLSLAPDIVEHLGEISYGQETSQVKMPLFKTMRMTTNVTVFVGNYILLGVHSDRNRNGENADAYTFVFARCMVRERSDETIDD